MEPAENNQHPEARKQKKPRKQKDKWVNLTAEQASGQHSTLSAHQVASQIYLQYLTLNKEQDAELTTIYRSGDNIEDTVFHPDSDTEQLAAAAILAANYLDLDARESLGDRWSVRWGKTDGKGAAQTRKVLYQWYVTYK